MGLEGLIWWLNVKISKANKRDYDAASSENRGRPKAGFYAISGAILAFLFIAVPLWGLMYLLR